MSRLHIPIGLPAALALLAAPSLTMNSQAQQIGANFTGTNLTETINLNGGVIVPPDTDGAVGLTQYGQFINGSFAIYDKTTGAVVGNKISDTTFWTNAGISSSLLSGGLSDTRLIFDHASQRWFAAEITTPASNVGNSILIARSNTSDLTQGFKAVSVTPQANRFQDFTTLGINADSIQIGTNEFTANNSFAGVTLTSIPKASLLQSTPTTANNTIFTRLDPTTHGDTFQSVIDYGPSTGHASIVATDSISDPSTSLYRFNVNNPAAANATLSSVFTPTVQSYTTPPNATQPGTNSTPLSTNDFSISSAPVKVGDLIYLAHTTAVNGHAAIRWTVLSESTNQVVQEGTIGDGVHDYYFPSIAANSAGNVVIGFTRSGATEFASAYAVAGTTTNGVLSFSNPILLKAGTSTYTAETDAFGPTSAQRWGDYSATSLDPSNPNSFWTVQEFATTDSTTGSIWSTQITQLNFAPVPETSTFVSLAGMGLMGAGLLVRRRKVKPTNA